MKNIFKTATIVFFALFIISCSGTADVESQWEQDLALVFDKNIIKSGEETAVIKVFYKGVDVTEQSQIFQIQGGKFSLIKGYTFSASSPGEYSFQAAYLTEKSDIMVIHAVDKDIPGAIEDPQPSSTSFVKRAFLNQYTGAACGNCPVMIKMLREAFYFKNEETEKYEMPDVWKEKIVLASIRNYSGEIDFADIGTPLGGWPHLSLDYVESYSVSNPRGAMGLQDRVNQLTKNPAKVGISANTAYYSDNNQIIVRVTVKAAEDGYYNLGLWLMQDNYIRTQTDGHNIIGGDDSYHCHHNCVRVADSKSGGSHIGYPLGTLKKGETASRLFVMNIDSAWYLPSNGSIEDFHFAAFVTSKTVDAYGNNVYSVLNAIDFKYNQQYPYDYISE